MTIIYNRSDKISAHFSHYEVCKSSTADRYDIDNTPNSEVLENAVILADNVLEPIRVHFGYSFSPNSWYRSEALETVICYRSYEKWCVRKGLGGPSDQNWAKYFARKSHPKGKAADIEMYQVDNDDLYVWVKKNLQYDQLIREFPKPGDPNSGWVHVSFDKNGNRMMNFTIG